MADPRIARVVDLETTGTPDDDNAEIIEMGRIDVHIPTLKIGRPWRSFASPRGPIPPTTKAVHHITEEDVKGAPIARELWDDFFKDLDATNVLVAHNARFEQHFIPSDGRQWVCTYKCARVVWPDAPGHGNQALRYWLGLELDAERTSPPHRALPDAYVTAHILCELLKLKSIHYLIEVSKYPTLLKVMNFGKHKGTAFADAPEDYLVWLRDKSEMDEDTKFSAGYWLKKRGQQ